MRNPKIPVVRPRPQVVACERVGGAAEILADDGPFDVLVAGPSMATKAGLARLQIVHDELPGMPIVLAFDRRPEARLRDIVRVGAVDLLQLPIDDRGILASVNRAIDVARRLSPGGSPAVTPAANPVTGKAPGHVFTISSATGGCGKTFYATNLAYFLTQYTGKSACIVDLDLQFGEVSTALRLRPRYTISDALERGENGDDDLQAHITDYIVTHESGVHVLAAPKDPSEAYRINPPEVTRVLTAVRASYDYVIVDTPGALTETVLAALDLSDELYVMATLDLPSVRNMAVFLNTLEKLKIPSDNVRLVLNKEQSDVGLNTAQDTKMFSQGISSVLPYSRDVSRSINMGMPVLGFAPRSEVSRRLLQGMRPLLPADQRHRVEEANGHSAGGFLSRMFRRFPDHLELSRTSRDEPRCQSYRTSYSP